MGAFDTGGQGTRHGIGVEGFAGLVGNQRAGREMLGRQVLLGDPEQVLGGGGAQGLEITRLGSPVAAEDFETAELACHARDALALEVFAGEKIGPGTLELALADGFYAKPLHLGGNGLEGFATARFVALESDGEEAAVVGGVGRAVDAIDQRRALANAAHQAAGFALAEHEGEQVEVGGVLVAKAGRRPGQVEPLGFKGAPLHRAPQGVGSRLGRALAPFAARTRRGKAFGEIRRQGGGIEIARCHPG